MAETIIKNWLSRDIVLPIYGIHFDEFTKPTASSRGNFYPSVGFCSSRWESQMSADLHLSSGKCIPIEIVHPETGGTLIRRKAE